MSFREVFIDKRGFTLIDLVLTILIASLLSVAAIPYFNGNSAVVVDATARKLVSDLSYARRMAHNRNTYCGISFNAGLEKYSVIFYNSSTGTTTAVTDPLTGTNMVVDFGLIPEFQGADLQSPAFGGSTTVLFNSRGIPTNAATTALAAQGTVVLANGGVTRTVRVQPNTGEISYQ
jgi:Tfp pilus assembly protein FimT